MLPILNIRTTGRSDKLSFYLRARAAGALDAYTAVSAATGPESPRVWAAQDAAWNVYRALTLASDALDDAVVAYWTAEETRLNTLAEPKLSNCIACGVKHPLGEHVTPALPDPGAGARRGGIEGGAR